MRSNDPQPAPTSAAVRERRPQGLQQSAGQRVDHSSSASSAGLLQVGEPVKMRTASAQPAQLAAAAAAAIVVVAADNHQQQHEDGPRQHAAQLLGVAD